MSIARGPPSEALPEYQTLAWGAIQESEFTSLPVALCLRLLLLN
jgi:hypothetical protein